MRRPAAGWVRPAHGLGLVLAASLALVPLAAARPAEIPLRPCTLGGAVEARCGTLRVPENRAVAGGRTIRLRVAVVPARDRGSSPDALLYLAGGPGGSAIAGAVGVQQLFSATNESHDIVLVDQRGTGSSNRMECPLPAKPLGAAAASVRAFVKACLARFDDDVRQYTTAPAMEDVADVIHALGYERVDVYGISYGATAAQYLIAQHPELVRTAILDGGTLLDVPIFERWAPNGERSLRSILARCATSPRCARAFPRARSEVFEMMKALRQAPVRANGMVIRAAEAAGAVQSLTRTPDGAARIPWIAHRAASGDWEPLVFAMDELGTGGVATRQLMFWSIVCNEPWARWSPAKTQAASRGTYLAERVELDSRISAVVCSAMPKAAQPEWSKARVRSNVPVLFVVGGNDPQDPIANVRGAVHELPASRTIVVPNAGHGALQLGCLRRVAQRFIESGTAIGLETDCVDRYTPPPFVVR
ncbi:MAG TPA: alpha/beta hydrolase [Gaiella sp.]